jgi:ribosomal protein S12 methylthiotransferase
MLIFPEAIPLNMPKVGFVSLGCPKNLVDSEVMMGVLTRNGYELTPRAEDADVLVVNTCSFIAPAQQESINTILELAEHKKTGKARRLVVAGCLVERYRDQLLAEIPEVDAIVGTGEIEGILDACAADLNLASAGNRGQKNHAQPPSYLYHDTTPRIVATPQHTAYIKINEGCDHPCTFCIIPELRGVFRSRQPDSVVREAENLALTGVREITLVGQDTTFFGEDIGIRDGLPHLLDRLAQIDPLLWVRFLYCYPNRITQRLLDTLAAHGRLAKYIDVPLQHASRSVLARMKRGSHGGAFLKLIERVRRTIPGVSLRTSFIVGFPGETETDFRELCDFVRAAEFDWLGVFAYSDEETAESHALGGKVKSETIARRRHELMSLQRTISRRKLRARVGQTFTAMIEGPARDTDLLWEARLEGMAPEIDGKVYISEIAELEDGGPLPSPGTRARVEITRAMEYDLIGRVIEWTREPALERGMTSPLSSSPARSALSVPKSTAAGLVQISAAMSGGTLSHEFAAASASAFGRLDAR